jgi:hypothetical protein
MIGRGIAAALVLALGVTAAPARACTIVGTPPLCDARAACTPALIAQIQRERAQRQAIEDGRRVAHAVEQRRISSSLDRGYDLARILLPNMVLPLGFEEDTCSGVVAEDEDGGGQESDEQAAATIRQERGLAPDAQLTIEMSWQLAARRTRCNTEIRRDLAVYLNSALPSEQLRELWDFVVPRAGGHIPPDGAQDLKNNRLLYFGEDGALRIPDEQDGLPPHVAARRERAGEYLANHRNGRAVMSALIQFVAARVANGRSEAALCPATMRGQV